MRTEEEIREQLKLHYTWLKEYEGFGASEEGEQFGAVLSLNWVLGGES